MAGTEPIARLKESIDLVGSVAKYGTLLVGGVCLLLYSHHIGRFPEGIGLGEGLAFYLMCAGFLVVYGLYAVLCIAGGAVVLIWPIRFAQRRLRMLDEKRQVHFRWFVRTDFSVVTSPPFVAVAVLSLALHFGYIYYRPSDSLNGWLFLAVPLVQAVGFLLFLVLSRRYEHVMSGLVTDEDMHTPASSSREELVIARRVFVVWLIVAPMLIAPEKLFLVNAAFRLAQLRKDNATVHVKAPWSARLEQSALVGRKSFLGGDHVCFDNINVLLRSVGENVVIELPTKQKPTPLAIPREFIYVE